MILPGVVVGLTAIVFLPWAGWRAEGLLWLFSPLLIQWLSQPAPKAAPVRERDQTFLLHEASQIWRYFEEHLNEETTTCRRITCRSFRFRMWPIEPRPPISAWHCSAV